MTGDPDRAPSPEEPGEAVKGPGPSGPSLGSPHIDLFEALRRDKKTIGQLGDVSPAAWGAAEHAFPGDTLLP